MSKWISVKQGLPKHSGKYLVYSPTFEDIWIVCSFYVGEGFLLSSVTHWMPLPKPPRGRSEER